MVREISKFIGEFADELYAKLRDYKGEDIKENNMSKFGENSSFTTYLIEGEVVMGVLYNKSNEKTVSDITISLDGEDDEIKEARDILKEKFGIEFRLKEEVKESEKERKQQIKEKRRELEKILNK